MLLAIRLVLTLWSTVAIPSFEANPIHIIQFVSSSRLFISFDFRAQLNMSFRSDFQSHIRSDLFLVTSTGSVHSVHTLLVLDRQWSRGWFVGSHGSRMIRHSSVLGEMALGRFGERGSPNFATISGGNDFGLLRGIAIGSFGTRARFDCAVIGEIFDRSPDLRLAAKVVYCSVRP